jgi:Short C-terminal domain
MLQLTPEARQAIEALSQQFGVSVEAVMTLLKALVQGNGVMAQFQHPELGGSGQWMQGGMVMVGDMFNNAIKTKVSGICSALSQLLATPLFASVAPQTSQHTAAPRSAATWWPAAFGTPTKTGSQNNMRYAYFAAMQRLVLERDGDMAVYDTQDHQIRGVSQQQSAGASIAFTSQHGTVDISTLPRLSTLSSASESATSGAPKASSASDAVLHTLERLADLHRQGILSDDEFAAKKTELLQRL